MRRAVTATWLLASFVVLLPAAAQGRARLEGLAGRLVQEHGLRGADRAAAMAKTHGLKVRRVGGVEQVAVILEPRGARAAKGIDPARLSALGATVDATSASYVRVLVPFGRLEALASHPDIAVVRTPTPHKALGGVGPFVSEAVALTGAAELQAAGTTGDGVKVAVVDLGFIGLQAAINAGELPYVVEVALPGQNGNLETGTEHGTGVAEHVADMAPGAEIHCILVDDEVDLQNAADYMGIEGIRVANHSVGWVNSSYYDNSGPIASVVNVSREAGVFWAVAAGNDADYHWRGDWTDADGDGRLNFSGNDERLGLTTSSSTVQLFLNWDQYGASETDLDLYVYDRRGRVAASSEGTQTGSQEPAEAVAFTYSSRKAPYSVEVRRYSGPTAGLDVTIFSFNNKLEYPVVAASLMEPADAVGAFSVGAVDQAGWDNGAPIEPFSSQGPTTDGRAKPDLAAPDGTSSMTYGAEGSYGTSFASPTTAGAAALLFSADPGADADAIALALTSGAVDAGAPGYDLVYGAGLLALAAGPACALDEDCDDGDACNGAETCEAGTCLAGTPVGCDDGNPCNGVETCDPGTGGCLAGTPPVCDDGDVCNGAETCGGSGCVAGVALDCDDLDACTEDSCDALAGCAHVTVVCDDLDPCTLDSCDVGLGCQFEPITCVTDLDACTVDACDSANGSCIYPPLDCGDGDACTIDDCDAATGCQHQPLDCGDGNACTVDSCDHGTGCRNEPLACGDGDACTIDACDPATGCANVQIVACANGDGCCPNGCDGGDDSDCPPLCGAKGDLCSSKVECCSNRCRKGRCR